MRHIVVVVLVAVLALNAHPLFAQTAPGASANPFSQATRQAWEGATGNVKASADMMPEANYAFRPVDTVRTFGQIVAHLAGANYVFCAAAKGEKPPHAEDAFEKTATTKAAIVKALDESLAYCSGVYSGLDDKRAAEVIELPFGMGRGTRQSLLMGNNGHLQEHYGNIVTYLRMKGLVPPSSAPRR